MIVELTPEKRDLLLRLVNSAIREIGPEIRHTATSTYKDDLKDERRALQSLHKLLTGTAPAAAVPPPAEFRSGLLGTP